MLQCNIEGQAKGFNRTRLEMAGIANWITTATRLAAEPNRGSSEESRERERC